LTGQTGPSGPTGPAGSSAPVAVFVGYKWGPDAPYTNALLTIAQNVLMSLGAIPFATGTYLIHLEMQVAWHSQQVGVNTWNGDIQLNQRFDPGTYQTLYDAKFGRINSDNGRQGNGVIESLGYWFVANNVEQNWNLELQASGDAYPVGCQVTIFNVPSYVIIPSAPTAGGSIIANYPTN
jgi:hypothetical protein